MEAMETREREFSTRGKTGRERSINMDSCFDSVQVVLAGKEEEEEDRRWEGRGRQTIWG